MSHLKGEHLQPARGEAKLLHRKGSALSMWAKKCGPKNPSGELGRSAQQGDVEQEWDRVSKGSSVNGRGEHTRNVACCPSTFSQTPTSSNPGNFLPAPSILFLQTPPAETPHKPRPLAWWGNYSSNAIMSLPACIPQSHPKRAAKSSMTQRRPTAFPLGGCFPIGHTVFTAKQGFCGRACPPGVITHRLDLTSFS